MREWLTAQHDSEALSFSDLELLRFARSSGLLPALAPSDRCA